MDNSLGPDLNSALLPFTKGGSGGISSDEAGPEGFLAALQLADSFFPTGMYAHSHGLEGLINLGLVANPYDVEEFLRNQLVWSVLPLDGVALINARAAAAESDLHRLMSVDRLLSAMKLPQEFRSASAQTGHRLITETGNFINHPVHAKYREEVAAGETPGNAAVALGVAAGALGIPEVHVVLMFCHTHAVSILGAALRLLPLTHTDAQLVLRRLQPEIIRGVDEIAGIPWQDMASFTPELDIAAMRHEAGDLRLFAS